MDYPRSADTCHHVPARGRSTSVCVCVWVSQREIKTKTLQESTEHWIYIDWLLGWLTWEPVNGLRNSFLSPQAFFFFLFGVSDGSNSNMSVFHFSGDKCLNFCFCVFKEIGKVFIYFFVPCVSGLRRFKFDFTAALIQLWFTSDDPVLCALCLHVCLFIYPFSSIF